MASRNSQEREEMKSKLSSDYAHKPHANKFRPREPLFTAREVAAYLSVSLDHVFRLTKQGMPNVEIGSVGGKKICRRYRMSEVDAWLKKRTQSNSEEKAELDNLIVLDILRPRP
jgi:predicted DNA-binding transcriptional regulator AlpA